MAIFPPHPLPMPDHLHPIQSSFPNKEPSRDKRIQKRILADAHDTEGIMLAWYEYLGEALNFPFTAMVLSRREENMTYYHQFRLLRMSPLDHCGKLQMWAIAKPSIGTEHFHSHVFISDIYSLENHPGRIRAIEDWIYWRKSHQTGPLWEL